MDNKVAKIRKKYGIIKCIVYLLWIVDFILLIYFFYRWQMSRGVRYEYTKVIITGIVLLFLSIVIFYIRQSFKKAILDQIQKDSNNNSK